MPMIFFGILFGFLLTRVGATDPDAITAMFQATDLHLAGVIGMAVVVAGVGLRLLVRAGIHGPGGTPLAIAPKPFKPGLVAGSLLFGAGWAMTGACPGTSLAQLGGGGLAGLVVVTGVLAGTWLYGRTGARVEAWGRAHAVATEPPVAAT